MDSDKTISIEPIDKSELESESDYSVNSSTSILSGIVSSRDDISEVGKEFINNKSSDILQTSRRLKMSKKKYYSRSHPYISKKPIHKTNLTVNPIISIDKGAVESCALNNEDKNQNNNKIMPHQTRNRFVNYSVKIFGYLSYPVNVYTAFMILSQFEVPEALAAIVTLQRAIGCYHFGTL